ncbi:hypothetical protein N1031_02020 [Herbiconiux moechotypicola]|uniref:Uncharacterized protein n=2 Tax=Herbiconiux moechotypicola TaxID=637393 RepID=A0ABP5Q2I7_9MICO|nr:hypothetical protein [Herbiconiux moechotypicola]MCS5728529.1 hypothetical protein [Herbiconiux moechotypicola]
MLGAVLLILIGAADLIRGARAQDARRGLETATIAVVWLLVLVITVLGLGVPAWWVLVPLVLAVGWVWSTSAKADVRRATGILPGVGVLVAVPASMLLSSFLPEPGGFLVAAHAAAPLGIVRAVPLEAIVLGAGVALFLVESANIVVRAALRPAVLEADDVAAAAASAEGATAKTAPAAGSSRLRWWRRPPVVPIAPAVTDLKGGRLIGPLERLLITALTLAGALPIVAGILAAKGIVRFPEISIDGGRGSKAEYFLVGSLVSWAIALAAAALLWVAAQG